MMRNENKPGNFRRLLRNLRRDAELGSPQGPETDAEREWMTADWQQRCSIMRMQVVGLQDELRHWKEQALLASYLLALRSGGEAIIRDIDLLAVRPCEIVLDTHHDKDNRCRVIKIVSPKPPQKETTCSDSPATND